MNKSERFHEFIQRLDMATAAESGNEAFSLLSDTLIRVEDELSNIPCVPSQWMNDGRMYPPQADSRRATKNPRVTRYRSKQHNTYIGQNGAIKIMDIRSGAPVIDKAGRDQRKVDDL